MINKSKYKNAVSIGLYSKGQFYLLPKNRNRRLIFCGFCAIIGVTNYTQGELGAINPNDK